MVEAGEAYVSTSYSEERMVVLIYSTKRWQAIPRMDFDTLINMGFVNARDTLLQYKKEKMKLMVEGLGPPPPPSKDSDTRI